MEKRLFDFYPYIIIYGLEPVRFDVSHIDVSHRQEHLVVNAIYECKHCGIKLQGFFTFFLLKSKDNSFGIQYSGMSCFGKSSTIKYLS